MYIVYHLISALTHQKSIEKPHTVCIPKHKLWTTCNHSVKCAVYSPISQFGFTICDKNIGAPGALVTSTTQISVKKNEPTPWDVGARWNWKTTGNVTLAFSSFFTFSILGSCSDAVCLRSCSSKAVPDTFLINRSASDAGLWPVTDPVCCLSALLASNSFMTVISQPDTSWQTKINCCQSFVHSCVRYLLISDVLPQCALFWKSELTYLNIKPYMFRSDTVGVSRHHRAS